MEVDLLVATAIFVWGLIVGAYLMWFWVDVERTDRGLRTLPGDPIPGSRRWWWAREYDPRREI